MQDAGIAEPWDRVSVPALVAVERLDTNLFRSRFNQRNMNDSLFGGQVLSQALAAATATAEGRPVHSLHGYFLRAGKVPRRVFYHVDRTRDGRAFSTRRVTAVQEGETIFHMECSFHAPEPGYEHQLAMAAAPDPETLIDVRAIVAAGDPRVPPQLAERIHADGPVEIRPIDPEALFAAGKEAGRDAWMRIARDTGTDDAGLHAQLLAYLSDYGLAGAALARHEPWLGKSKVFVASIDHAMWFHRPARADEWLLFRADSPSAAGGTGLSRGLIYDRAGRLVASTAQESLQRWR